MIATVLPLLISILTQAPQVIESVEKIWDMLNRDDVPSPEEQEEFDRARVAAHKAVQDM